MNTAIDSPSYWDEMYKNNQAGWDLKSSNPVFEEILRKNNLINPGKIMIIGCGKGYDAVAAAKAGYKVTAVDFSPFAIDFAKDLAERENVQVNFLIEDFFNLNHNFENKFDIVYDYTTFCAVNPERRNEYAKTVSSILKPNGKLLALLFPVEKRVGGPPYGIDVIEFYKLFSKYLKLEFSSKQINSIKPRRGREVLQIYVKK